jgi:hypothetical protein
MQGKGYMMKKITGKNILNVRMQDNDAGVETIGDYLQTLLLDLWIKSEVVNSKRPFGNSSWNTNYMQP